MIILLKNYFSANLAPKFLTIFTQFFFYRFNELNPPSSLVSETFSAGRKSTTDQYKTFQ